MINLSEKTSFMFLASRNSARDYCSELSLTNNVIDWSNKHYTPASVFDEILTMCDEKEISIVIFHNFDKQDDNTFNWISSRHKVKVEIVKTGDE